MSIFGTLWSKITGHQAAAAPASPAAPSAAATPAASAPMDGVSATSSSSAVASSPVDVEAIMTDLEQKAGHKTNWRESIVDLMSLLGMDNSLSERRALAKELGYTGDTNDTATMNIWLHKQVMQKMAENGGKVPANMLD
jgi:hypothetical protein